MDLRVDETLHNFKHKFFTYTAREIHPYQGANIDGTAQELCSIIDQALQLDKEISRQLSRISWDMGYDDDNSMAFDSNLMELEGGQTLTGSEQVVSLVLSPAVIKRGKSTGDGFDEESVLLRMEVSCENLEV